jgi:hypothetical protein
MNDEGVNRPEGSFRVYRTFGIRMGSTHQFRHRLIDETGRGPDVVFSLVNKPPFLFDWEGNAPLYQDKKLEDGSPFLLIYRLSDYLILRFPEMDFYTKPDLIEMQPRKETGIYLLELGLFGRVISLWLELHGIPCLHASSAVVDDQAIGFLSSSHGGKSVLAASLMRDGYQLLTDDILPVTRKGGVFQGMPGNPSMRMWPDQAEYFLGSYEHLDLVEPPYSKRLVPVGPDGFGTFCSRARPLKVLYVPEKQKSDEEISIEAIDPKDAFFELVKNSFTARIVELLGLQPQRMKFFADMVMQIPLRRLRYPTGFQHLSRVKDAILKDIEFF